MRYVLLLMLAAVGGWAVLQIDKLDPDNYVKMYIGSYVVEVKLLGFLLLLVLVVFALYFVLSLFRMFWRAPKTYSNWRGRKINQTADASLGAGYLALVKGDWKYAEKRLTSKTEHSSLPYINYLAAAQAAQEQGKLEQRDRYLNAAYKEAPKERLAIGLVKAQLHQKAGQLDQALATLGDIKDIGVKNSQFTAMLMQTYEQRGDWESAKELLPKARKQQALSQEALDIIDNQIHSSNLVLAEDKYAAWKGLPKNQKNRMENVLIYARHLVAEKDEVAAEKLIRVSLKSNWSDDLVQLYGELNSAKPEKLRRNVEGWLMGRPESAELNLAAGRLAISEKDYERAKEFLMRAIKLGNLPAAYGLLGEAYEASNESDKALQFYRAGVVAALSGVNAAGLGITHNEQPEPQPEAELIVAEE